SIPSASSPHCRRSEPSSSASFSSSSTTTSPRDHHAQIRAQPVRLGHPQISLPPLRKWFCCYSYQLKYERTWNF
ncbi:hypothetical protein PanWU01x14_149040, partial [Parasponia andersonii]